MLTAGEKAGTLTEEGAKRLDVSGNLESGILLAPPEGDAGTGMVATNSVAVRTGNVSAGTSVFAMVVLEKALKAVHEELDMVTTPSGDAVAMVHCNNCTSDLNAWVGLFKEFSELFGMDIDMNDIYGKLYNNALTADKDCGGLVAFNLFSGEPVIGLNEGRPMFARKPDARMNLANFMRTHLYASLATLKSAVIFSLKRKSKGRHTLRSWWSVQDKGCGPEHTCSGHGCTGCGHGDSRRGRPVGHGSARSLYGE